MSAQTTTDSAGASTLTAVLGPVADAQTYRNLLYLVLAFPLGMVYYFVLVLGFTLGVALSVFLVGLAILLGTVVGLRFIASFERGLANALLDTSIAPPDDVDRSSGGVVGTTKAYVRASSTWRGLGFVALKFPLGVLSFVLLVTFLGTALELLLLPVSPEGAFNVRIAGWRVAQVAETGTHRLIAVPVGAALGVLSVHVLNAFARANVSVASSLLGPSSDAAEQTSPDDPE
jgi:hypothetical protein